MIARKKVREIIGKLNNGEDIGAKDFSWCLRNLSEFYGYRFRKIRKSRW